LVAICCLLYGKLKEAEPPNYHSQPEAGNEVKPSTRLKEAEPPNYHSQPEAGNEVKNVWAITRL
jgi:hypothetical protein